ncbi:membrane-spanning 4-domains subfamily A member 4D-like [Pelodytes ibericus]
MSSLARSDAGGFVIISQVNPSANAEDAQAQTAQAQNKTPKPLTKFYKGEPEALGVTQICTGVIQITLGIIIALQGNHFYHFDLFTLLGVPFWSGLMYIVSGSVSVSAANKPTVCKVTSSLVLNIISSLTAFVSLIMMLILFLIVSSYLRSYRRVYCSYDAQSLECKGEFDPQTVMEGLVGMLMIFTLLQFCITISISVFGCKTVCRTSYSETTVIIYQNTSINAGDNVTSSAPKPLVEG